MAQSFYDNELIRLGEILESYKAVEQELNAMVDLVGGDQESTLYKVAMSAYYALAAVNPLLSARIENLEKRLLLDHAKAEPSAA